MDPWVLVIQRGGVSFALRLEGSFLTPEAMALVEYVPAAVSVHAIRAATTARQAPQDRRRGHGPRGDCPHGWTWKIEEGEP